MTVWDNVAFGLTIRQPAEGGDPRARRRAARARAARRVSATGIRRSSPAGSGSAWRSRARSPPEPEVLLLDEPFGALDARVRKELREWLLRLHDEMHVTTIFVTHDQEEALELADTIVVMNTGRVEQVGAAARALRRAGERVRDELRRAGEPGSATRGCARTTSSSRTSRTASTHEAQVERIVRLGFEVRVDLVRDDGERLHVQLTRDEADELELARGDIVYVRTRREQTFAQRDRLTHASGSRVSSAMCGGSSPLATSASVTCSRTDAHARAERDPDVAQRRGRALVLERVGGEAAHVRERAVDGADDVGERRSRPPGARAGSRRRRRAGCRRSPRGGGRGGCSRGS